MQPTESKLDLTGAPSLLRRLAAVFYDALLLIGVLFVASLPLPLIVQDINDVWWVRLLVQAYLLLVCLFFFAWFWVHGGQTLGMRAWRLQVTKSDGSPITWDSAVIRFFSAILSWLVFGLGFLWVLIDAERRAWHDRLSNTTLALKPKR
ncbi:MAG: RDD family protein [Arenicellales bacterium]|nr:RDD family protein [Arenicellales bacterium]